MAKDTIATIKKLVAAKQVIIGYDRTLKLLRQDKLAKVFLSNDCAAGLKENLLHYCGLKQIDCIELDKTGEELGTACKKPFPISVIGVAK